jgi:hypothetical protein
MPVARRTSTDVLLRARLLLVMALAIYTAVSTGQWDAKTNPTPAEKKDVKHQPKKLERSKTSFFTRGLRCIARLILNTAPLPPLWSAKTDGC